MAAESSVVLAQSATSTSLRPIAASGWTSGFGNLLRHELRPWLRTRFGLLQAGIWLLALNGFMAVPLWLAPLFDPRERTDLQAEGGALTLGLLLFFRLGVQVCGVGAAILAMSALVGDKQSGTAAWVLSKPASRAAFVLAKYVALSVGSLLTMVGLQSAIAYVHIGLAGGRLPDAAPFAVASALLGLNVLFALALTLVLGAFLNSRGTVVGVAIGILFGQQVLGNFLGPVASYLPESLGALAAAIALGQSNAVSYAAVFSTTILTLGCVAAAIWRFGRDEL
jgi:ABC-2 type transport system permease protein